MPPSFFEKLRAAARKGFGAANGNAAGSFTAATAAVLSKAAWEQDTATVRHIITRWPEAIHVAGDGGLTALHCAALGMDDAQVGWLLARGADKDARDKTGHTPLHFAAQSAQPEGTQKLIAAGAQIDARNDKGETPLYYAVMFERAQSVEMLVAAGANENTARHDGETPRSLAPKEDKQRPGGLAPGSLSADMTAVLDAALRARSDAFAAAPVLAGDLSLPVAPRVHKRHHGR